MDALLGIALTNAVTATLLGIGVAVASRWIKRPALAHALWLIVLCDLLTPPVVKIAVLPAPGIEKSVLRSAVAADRRRGSILEGGHAASGNVQSAFASKGRASVSDAAAHDPHELQVAGPTARGLGLRGGVNGEVESASKRSGGAGPSERAGALARGAASRLQRLVREAAAAAVSSLQRAGGWIEGIWLAGTISVLLLGILRAARFNRKIACPRLAAPELQEASDALAARIRLRRAPRLRLVRGRISPLVWFRRGSPTVLFPERLLAQLGSGERDSLLLHELAHVKRGDHWVRLLEFAASSIFWWHPLLYWARREMRRAEEKTCDAWVLRARPGVSEEYARGLVKTMEFLAGVRPSSPALATGLDTYQLMEERLNMILRERAPKSLSKPQAIGLAVIAMTVLLAFPTRAARSSAPEQGRSSAAPVAEAPTYLTSTSPGSATAPAPPPPPRQSPPAPPAAAFPPTPRAPAAPPAPPTAVAPVAAPDGEASGGDHDDAQGEDTSEDPAEDGAAELTDRTRSIDQRRAELDAKRSAREESGERLDRARNSNAEVEEELQEAIERLDEARAEQRREYEETLERSTAIGVEGQVRGQVEEGVRGGVEGAPRGGVEGGIREGIDGGIQGGIEGGPGSEGGRDVEGELRAMKRSLAELNRESERLSAARKELLSTIAAFEKELKAPEAPKRH